MFDKTIPNAPIIIKRILFCLLSEIFPKIGGNTNKAKGKIVIINCITGFSTPKYSKYFGKYTINPIPAVLKTKIENKIRMTDRLESII